MPPLSPAAPRPQCPDKHQKYIGHVLGLPLHKVVVRTKRLGEWRREAAWMRAAAQRSAAWPGPAAAHAAALNPLLPRCAAPCSPVALQAAALAARRAGRPLSTRPPPFRRGTCAAPSGAPRGMDGCQAFALCRGCCCCRSRPQPSAACAHAAAAAAAETVLSTHSAGSCWTGTRTCRSRGSGTRSWGVTRCGGRAEHAVRAERAHVAAAAPGRAGPGPPPPPTDLPNWCSAPPAARRPICSNRRRHSFFRRWGSPRRAACWRSISTCTPTPATRWTSGGLLGLLGLLC